MVGGESTSFLRSEALNLSHPTHIASAGESGGTEGVTEAIELKSCQITGAAVFTRQSPFAGRGSLRAREQTVFEGKKVLQETGLCVRTA